MNNPPSFRFGENYAEDDKYFEGNFPAVMENDYLLNYLNESEAAQRRSFQMPNIFGQQPSDLQLPLPNFQDLQNLQNLQNPTEALQNIYGKFNLQESWMLPANEAQKLLSEPTSATFANKFSNVVDETDGSVKMKKLKTNNEAEVKRAADASAKMKSNIKNTYINKINSLITEPKENPKSRSSKGQDSSQKGDGKRALVLPEDKVMSNNPQIKMGMKKVKSCDVLKSDELEKLNQKLAKNRESARNSRIRKKVYIELLEKTVDQLQQELVQTRKQVEAHTNQASKVSFEARPKQITNLFTGKQQLFDRLEKMVETKADESELSFLIDSLRLRFGASGKDRVDAVNFLFKQIMEFLVPVHMKYLLWAASQGKDLFNVADLGVHSQALAGNIPQISPENTEYWNKIAVQMNISDGQKKHLLKYKKKLQGEKQKFETLITSMNNVRKAALKQANSLQIVIDEFRNYMTPTQTAQLLVVLERERNRKELSADKLWVTIKKESHDDDSEESDTFLEGEDEEQDDNDEEQEYSHSSSITPVE